jgi:hypothetical protein
MRSTSRRPWKPFGRCMSTSVAWTRWNKDMTAAQLDGWWRPTPTSPPRSGAGAERPDPHTSGSARRGCGELTERVVNISSGGSSSRTPPRVQCGKRNRTLLGSKGPGQRHDPRVELRGLEPLTPTLPGWPVPRVEARLSLFLRRSGVVQVGLELPRSVPIGHVAGTTVVLPSGILRDYQPFSCPYLILLRVPLSVSLRNQLWTSHADATQS